MTSMVAGASVRYGATLKSGAPEARSVPHEAAGGWTPAPRKESAASRIMEWASWRGTKTTRVDVRFGRISLAIIRRLLNPRPRADSTNSRSRRASTSPRMGRAT